MALFRDVVGKKFSIRQFIIEERFRRCENVLVERRIIHVRIVTMIILLPLVLTLETFQPPLFKSIRPLVIRIARCLFTF